MPKKSMVNPRLQAIAAELPSPCWKTDELLAASGDRFSDKLVAMLTSLGVEKRHSVLDNYPAVLFEGAEPKLSISGTTLAVKAARQCIAKANLNPESIGLVLGVTSSPARLLPSLVCDLIAQMPEIPRTAANLSLTYMGCSAISKVVDNARWYLTCEPEKVVLVCFMDAITPLSPDLPGRYAHFTEVPLTERQRTVNAMHGFLFGDAAVAMILTADGDGPTFGAVKHLTNDLAEDAELGTVPDGGSDIPLVNGRRAYTLSPEVTPRGTYYATHTVKTLLESEDCAIDRPSQVSALFIHTGSMRILDGLCKVFEVPSNSEKVASSYHILRDYGNTIGCSIPLMLAESVHRSEGEALVVAFGLSFSCGAFSMTIERGGWTP
jgi:3-oxoacyl-[acyl-carrier-protein] synthase III